MTALGTTDDHNDAAGRIGGIYQVTHLQVRADGTMWVYPSKENWSPFHHPPRKNEAMQVKIGNVQAEKLMAFLYEHERLTGEEA
jgi:hypothetical protein